jgi:deoxycytidylate deaminase
MGQLKHIEFDPHNPSLYEYVPATHLFMQEACAEACKSGCGSRQVGAVIVKEGMIIACGHNSRNREPSPCPRVEQNLPSGIGYELCPHCGESDLTGHAEADTIENAKTNQVNTVGGELYMFGHWWACAPCWEKIRSVGITKIYLVENAAELFKQRGVLEEKSWYKNMKHET